MLQCSDVFTFRSFNTGTNHDGEKYVALNVIGKNDKKNYSFVSKNSMLINEIQNTKFIDFQDIEITVQFAKTFNQQTRFSRWECELVGIGKYINHGE